MTGDGLVLAISGRIGDRVVRELDAAGFSLNGGAVDIVYRAISAELEAEVLSPEETRRFVISAYRRGLIPDMEDEQ